MMICNRLTSKSYDNVGILSNCRGLKFKILTVQWGRTFKCDHAHFNTICQGEDIFFEDDQVITCKFES